MMFVKQSGLGRGLGAIIPPKPPAPPIPLPSVHPSNTSNAESGPRAFEPSVSVSSSLRQERVWQLPVEIIERNPRQPRAFFDHAQMEDLISSIKEYGVIQPLIVSRREDETYELIAGERRLRAAVIAGLQTVPCLVREVADQQKLELALIENIQRQDLNPVEEAQAYLQLINEFQLTQDDVAKKVGKSRSNIANTMRLLQLPEVIRRALIEGRITASNARTLLSLPSDEERLKLFQVMLDQNFTVRQAEAHVPHPRRHKGIIDPNLAAVENQLRTQLHCKVTIKHRPKGDGEVRLAFTSEEELQTLIDRLTHA